MKTFRFFGLMLMTVMMTFGMAACGSDDDDDDNDTSSKIETIAGTIWYQDSEAAEGWTNYETFIFDKNGNMHWGNLMKENNSSQWIKFTRHSFNYKVDGNTFTYGVWGKGIEDAWERKGTYTIQGDVLSIKWNDGDNTVVMKRIAGDMLNKYNSAIVQQ